MGFLLHKTYSSPWADTTCGLKPHVGYRDYLKIRNLILHTHIPIPTTNLGLSLTWAWGSWVLLRTGWWERGPGRSCTGPGPHGGCSQKSCWERRGSNQEPSTPVQARTKPHRVHATSLWALGACHKLLQATHSVLGHKDNLDIPLSVPKSGRREEWGCHLRSGRGDWGEAEDGGQKKPWKQIYLTPYKGKRSLYGLSDPSGFSAPPLGGTAHPLDPTSVLFLPLPPPGLLLPIFSLHSRISETLSQWAVVCRPLKGHLPCTWPSSSPYISLQLLSLSDIHIYFFLACFFLNFILSPSTKNKDFWG